MTDRLVDRYSGSRWTPWWPAAAVAVVILIASIIPVPSGSPTGAGGLLPFWMGLTDPFHFVGYSVLSICATRGTDRSARGLIVAVVASTGFGFGVELVQSLIPWRTFAWRDVAVNAVGAVTGIGVLTAYGGVTRRLGSRARE